MSIREFFTKNQDFIDVALKEGFFNDASNGDYLSSDDSIILFWIDELDKEKLLDNGILNEMKVAEVLANFRKYIQRGIRTKGVGTNYDLLILAEKNSLVVTPETFECILLLREKQQLVVPKNLNTFNSRKSYFHTIHILRCLRDFQLKGYKINSDFVSELDRLIYLEDYGEPSTELPDEKALFNPNYRISNIEDAVPKESNEQPSMRALKK